MKKQFRICYVTTISATIQSFILDTAVYLFKTGLFDITFVCDNDDHFARIVPSGMHYHPIPMKRGISLSGISSYREMKQYFKEQKFDLIQYSTPNASFYAAMAAAKERIPNRIYCQWGIAYVGFSGLKRSIFKMVEKKVCCDSTLIEPDSHGNLNFSIQEGLYPQDKGRVIGYGSAGGVDLKKFDVQKKEQWRMKIRSKMKYADDDIVYGFVGRLDKDKGINELLEAFEKCPVKNKKLLIVGPDDKKQTLDQKLYAASLQNPDIIYTGESHEVSLLLSAMDVFVLPSYREGFGSVVIEAEAMRLPVITTDIPGPRESIVPETTGIQIPKADANALLTAMVRMQDEKLREKMGKAGEKYVREHFDSEYVHQKILEDRLAILEKQKIRN